CRPGEGDADVVAQADEEALEPFGEIPIVVDDEDAAVQRRARSWRWRGHDRRLDFATGDANHELAAATRPIAVGGDGAAVHLDDGADERQPDAEAALRSVERLIRLYEGFEDPLTHVGRDADARVPNAEDDVAVLARRLQRDLAARRRVLGGVGQQI